MSSPFYLDPDPDHIDPEDCPRHTFKTQYRTDDRCINCDHYFSSRDNTPKPGRDCPDDCSTFLND